MDFNIDRYTDYLFNKMEREDAYDFLKIELEKEIAQEMLMDDERLELKSGCCY